MLSDTDSDLVTAAVARAEATTDAEIVTIVAPRSDEYRDVALCYAAGAMLLVPLFAALFPHLGLKLLALVHDGWSAPGEDLILGVLMIAQVVVCAIVVTVLGTTRRRIALVPKSIRHARVRKRAVLLFRVAAERRTDSRYGVLLYLSEDEHMAEIVADSGLTGKVGPETWGKAMAVMLPHVAKGHVGEGLSAAVERIGLVLATHFPKTAADTNELPDRPISL
ncbi:hypothetical protein [uncultured Sphingomonas sp.]|uniref:TPM domain-containing protein n=1 Tax=uncultured Sphingomonas sp. TaxID=158754 RepID=UPI0025DC75A8|nr:hypothetical protein [uncultured Sphingomonas sp.]